MRHIHFRQLLSLFHYVRSFFVCFVLTTYLVCMCIYVSMIYNIILNPSFENVQIPILWVDPGIQWKWGRGAEISAHWRWKSRLNPLYTDTEIPLVHMYTPTPRIPVVHIFGWDWSYITKIRGSINLQYCEYIFPYKILVI